MNIDLAAQESLDRMRRVGFERLSDRDKICATVWMFQAHVANRGFAKFFSGAGGELAAYAPAAFRAIGAEQLARISSQANDLFGPGGPPADREVRRAIVEGFDEPTKARLDELYAQFLHCPDDADELLETYLKSERSR